jgi:hypothetical protein
LFHAFFKSSFFAGFSQQSSGGTGRILSQIAHPKHQHRAEDRRNDFQPKDYFCRFSFSLEANIPQHQINHPMKNDPKGDQNKTDDGNHECNHSANRVADNWKNVSNPITSTFAKKISDRNHDDDAAQRARLDPQQIPATLALS